MICGGMSGISVSEKSRDGDVPQRRTQPSRGPVGGTTMQGRGGTRHSARASRHLCSSRRPAVSVGGTRPPHRDASRRIAHVIRHASIAVHRFPTLQSAVPGFLSKLYLCGWADDLPCCTPVVCLPCCFLGRRVITVSSVYSTPVQVGVMNRTDPRSSGCCGSVYGLGR